MTFTNRRNTSRESGVVSLLTVIFFMIFVSLIVVGFITIVIADQKQTTDNDLSASALAAARSGVEDGKRILLYCTQNPGASGCTEALNSQDNCKAFDSSAGAAAYGLATSLAVPFGTNGEGVTGGASASAYQQYFTCLTIQTKTPSLTTTLTDDSDYIQQLKTVSPFTKLKVSWSGEGSYAQRGSIVGWPTRQSWSTSKYMPVIQLQTIPYTGLADLNAVEAGTRTVYIVPCNGTCINSSSDINVLDLRSNAGDLRPTTTAPVYYAQCTMTAVSYDCSATLTGYNSAAQQYYVRASLLYASTTELTLSALDANGVVNLDGVQPWIDVTGRTNDVFKRVRAQVGNKPTVPLPSNALDSAAPICKALTVTNDPASTTYNCN